MRIPTCGWCMGEPKMVDAGAGFRCPICNTVVPKTEGNPREVVELGDYPEGKKLEPKPPKEEKPKKRRGVFNILEVLDSGKPLPAYKQKWLKEEMAKGIKCILCREKLNPLDPTWSYASKEWTHQCQIKKTN